MPLNSVQIITAKGQDKLAQALSSGLAVQITDVGLGDGNGLRYNPAEGQTALKNERVRRAITKQHMSDDRTWRVVVEFGTDVPSFTVREIGFFDNAGDLIFVVAGASMNEGTTGAYDLLYDAYFNLSHVKDGLVIVNAPDDALWAFSLSALTGLARSHLETQKLRDKLTALHGPF